MNKRKHFAKLLVSVITFLFAHSDSFAGIAASLWELNDGTPLMLAAQDGNLAKVEEFVRKGWNVNEASKEGEATPLIFAASSGKTQVVQFLLKNGADPNRCSWGDVCPLWWAVRANSTNTVKILLDAGANVNLQPSTDALEIPALQIAAGRGNISIVKLLVEKGAKVDHTNFFAQQTALAEAIASGHADVAQYLIDHGARLENATDVPYFKGKSALQVAQERRFVSVTKVVEEALSARKGGKAFSVEAILETLFVDPAFDLNAQGKELREFLGKQSRETLRQLRNSIFARKNFEFEDAALVAYFQKKFPSYRPSSRSVELSEIDKRNIQYVKELEQNRAARQAAE